MCLTGPDFFLEVRSKDVLKIIQIVNICKIASTRHRVFAKHHRTDIVLAREEQFGKPPWEVAESGEKPVENYFISCDKLWLHMAVKYPPLLP